MGPRSTHCTDTNKADDIDIDTDDINDTDICTDDNDNTDSDTNNEITLIMMIITLIAIMILRLR